MKVLITGGGCSEKIDDVRSITNFSSGRTALQIAKTIHAMNPAAAVTLLLAQSAVQPSGALLKKIAVKIFRSCDDLKKLLRETLEKDSYDLIFHAAAVSDYTVQSVVVDGKEFAAGKIHKISGANEVLVKLKKNPKLLEAIPRMAKKNNAAARVVGFKLTSNASQEERAAAVQKLFSVKNPPDFVISNDLSEITAKSHPCVLWQRVDKNGEACKTKNGGPSSVPTAVARGQVNSIVRKVYAFNS